MVWTKLLGGLAALGVAIWTLGALAGLGQFLSSSRPALVVFGLVVVVVLAIVGGGISERDGGNTTYW